MGRQYYRPYIVSRGKQTIPSGISMNYTYWDWIFIDQKHSNDSISLFCRVNMKKGINSDDQPKIAIKQTINTNIN